MDKILVIGAGGQLGTELVVKLREAYGTDHVIATDIREMTGQLTEGPTEKLNILDPEEYLALINKHGISQVYHLAAVLSAKGENDPLFAWKLNMDSLLTVLESGKDRVKKIYWPSSIAVFGPDTPADHTPQKTIMNPTTVYGISKLAGERWCEYYHQKYNVDVRSIRYPGLVGYKAMPGGGTTDYAVDVFRKAIDGENFECFLKADTALPMMYMEDAIRGTIQLMETEAERINIRTSYNFSGISFTPEELFSVMANYFPGMTFSYAPDFRQEIADTWPNSIDDSAARDDWNWVPEYDLKRMTEKMIAGLKSELVLN